MPLSHFDIVPEITSTYFQLLITALLSYLIGAIPFGLVVTRIAGLGDLRQIGSGNIGATNVLRTGNKIAALITLALDSGKGAFTVVIAWMFLGEDAAQLAALCSFLGHLFPIWLRFKGGKGVATFFGVLLMLSWPAGTMACATWLITAGIARISSLSALMAAVLSPIWLILFGYSQTLLVSLVMMGFIFHSHRQNIVRLRNRTEPKIGRGKGSGKKN